MKIVTTGPMRICISYLLPFLFASGLAHAGALERLFAPKPDLWSFWSEHDPVSPLRIDHSPWDDFLQRYVHRGEDGINRARYASVSGPDRDALENYIARLERTAIRQYSRSEQLAYWVNLYNAVTVNVVLRHYPVNSIRDIDISPGLFAVGPWGKKILLIEGQPVSLNDIEHRILRPIWNDPRLHYVLNCASLGCPNLHDSAYTADNISRLLDEAAREYVNHPRGVAIDNGEIRVSSIYSWFMADFGGSDASVIQHLIQYASADRAEALAAINHIADDQYDWALNDDQPVDRESETAGAK